MGELRLAHGWLEDRGPSANLVFRVPWQKYYSEQASRQRAGSANSLKTCKNTWKSAALACTVYVRKIRTQQRGQNCGVRHGQWHRLTRAGRARGLCGLRVRGNLAIGRWSKSPVLGCTGFDLLLRKPNICALMGGNTSCLGGHGRRPSPHFRRRHLASGLWVSISRAKCRSTSTFISLTRTLITFRG